MKIDHLENDTKIMSGKIEQLRSDFRTQEKVKKDLAEQVRYGEQKHDHDQVRLNELQQQLDNLSNERVRSKQQSQEVHNLRKVFQTMLVGTTDSIVLPLENIGMEHIWLQ